MTRAEIILTVGDGKIDENLYFVTHGPYEYQMCPDDSEKNKEVLIPGFNPEVDTHYLGPYTTLEEAAAVFNNVQLDSQLGIGYKLIQDRSVNKNVKEIFNVKLGCN